jgi:hypothetical protein
MKTHSDLRKDLIVGDEECHTGASASPPTTDYKPIQPRSLAHIGLSQGTCSAVSEGNDE